MRFCNNKIMLLWVKTRILTSLDLGGRGGKSSTGTTRHVTASQNWVVHSDFFLQMSLPLPSHIYGTFHSKFPFIGQ